LVEAFERAHFEATLGLIDEVATALRARPAGAPADWKPPILSANLAGGLHFGRWPEAAMRFDCLNNELNVAALEKDLAHFLGASAITEAAGATLLVMPSGASNRLWNKKEDPVAYARGTGLAYALGGHMHIPWCLYDGSQFTRYYGTPSLHQPIFEMIHRNRDRFDGYVPALWHLMEVPYSKAGIGDLKGLESDLRTAFDAGIPVTLRFRPDKPAHSSADPGGDGSLFGADRLSGAPVSTQVFGKDRPPQAGPFRLIEGFGGAYLPPVPRVSSEASTFPLVLHLLRGFNEKSAQSARFEISGKWLPAALIKDMSIVSVAWANQPDAGIRWKSTPGGNTLVEVSHVPAWGVIRIETKKPIQLPGITRGALRQQMAESEIPLMRMIRFSNRWKRPAWVDEALASPVDPLDGYHVTRITWSYEGSGKELNHARQKGWGFHGSIGLLHSSMGPSSDLAGSDVIRQVPEWPGWVRYADGQPMLIRPDWNPPRYGASFAAPEYRKAVVERARMWLALGTTGIQFDDAMGMLNRVWQYGGDFSDAMMTRLKAALIADKFPDVSERTSLDELRQQVVLASQWEKPCRIVNVAPPGSRASGWVAVLSSKETGISYPGEIWIGPRSFARPDAPFVVEYEARFTKGAGPWAEFILADGDRTAFLSRLTITPETHPGVPTGQWLRMRLRYDPVARTMNSAVGADAPWSEPIGFEASPAGGEPQSFAAFLMADYLKSGLDLRSITVSREPSTTLSPSEKP
jgi:hypothetical protein